MAEQSPQDQQHNQEPVTDFTRILQRALSRRHILQSGAAISVISFLAGIYAALPHRKQTLTSDLIGFEGIPASTEDHVTLAQGYDYHVLISWGDPLFEAAADFAVENNATQQSQQLGDNVDGMSVFALYNKDGSLSEQRALMAVNSEYTNRYFLHSDHGKRLCLEAVNKELHAHGVNLFEIQRDPQGHWQPVRGSVFNRRLHGNSGEFVMTGPVAGSHWIQTAADPNGELIVGTLNNCGSGQTPWGTFLTCEENVNLYFGARKGSEPSSLQQAYDLKEGEGLYGWWQHDERFDFSKHPNEPHRFGWVVEIDPYRPNSQAKKHSALGRFQHENAALIINKDGHVVVYMGDDAKGEFIYKFVSAKRFIRGDRQHNLTLLESGTLYAAQFHDDGRGTWLELTYGKNGLTDDNGFVNQAAILLHARIAARYLGATSMDRPEWIACHPSKAMVFCTLSNNKERGVDDAQPLNAANPRAENHFGQIIRWQPEQQDHCHLRFHWDLYALAGNPALFDDEYAGSDNINSENMFNGPDGLAFDKAGRLWIQTDGNLSNRGEFLGQGNNQMLCGDPLTGEIRRFMTAPVGSEITGFAFCAEHKTLFVGIQHPTGNWPNAQQDGVPRSSVIAIYRKDGGAI